MQLLQEQGHSVDECRKKKSAEGLADSKKKADAKKPRKTKKKDSDSSKEKSLTLFVTDRAPDDAVCSSTDKECASDNETGGLKDHDRTIEWILDSGCGRHLTGNASLLSSDIATAATSLYLPDGSTVQSTKRGTVNMKTIVGVVPSNLRISDVELVPGLTKNLLSYVRLERKGIRLVYEGKQRYLASQTSKLAEVMESEKLLVVHFYLSSAQNAALLTPSPSDEGSRNARNGGAVTPANQPGNIVTSSRVSTRTPDKRKPSRRLRDALATCAEAIDTIDECDSVCNVSLGDTLTYEDATRQSLARRSRPRGI